MCGRQGDRHDRTTFEGRHWMPPKSCAKQFGRTRGGRLELRTDRAGDRRQTTDWMRDKRQGLQKGKTEIKPEERLEILQLKQ